MKQMKMLAVKTETYVFSGHIDVDIVSNYVTKEYSAWIFLDDYDTKKLMFGMPMTQQSYERFVEIVEANVLDYFADYMVEMDKGE